MADLFIAALKQEAEHILAFAPKGEPMRVAPADVLRLIGRIEELECENQDLITEMDEAGL